MYNKLNNIKTKKKKKEEEVKFVKRKRGWWSILNLEEIQ